MVSTLSILNNAILRNINPYTSLFIFKRSYMLTQSAVFSVPGKHVFFFNSNRLFVCTHKRAVFSCQYEHDSYYILQHNFVQRIYVYLTNGNVNLIFLFRRGCLFTRGSILLYYCGI